MAGRTRREWLRVVGAAGVAAVAGCSGGDDGESDSQDGTDVEAAETATDAGGQGTEGQTGNGADGERVRAEPQQRSECVPQVVSSTIEQDTTWTPEDCPRLALDGNVQVRNGATLTVEAGVEVVARAGAKLTVKSDGMLRANGEPGNPVWFYGESDDPGHWETIEIESDRQNELSSVVVQNAGGGNWAGLWVRSGALVSVTDSAFIRNETWGAVLEDGATLSAFSNNGFSDNGTASVRVGVSVVEMLDTASTYAGGNGEDRITVDGGDLDSETAWPATDAPFFFGGNTRLLAPVTVDPGAQFTFGEGAKLTVAENGGVLTADAGGAETISFVGARSTPGHWRAIEIESDDPDNVLDNVEVAHGGSGNWANVWVSEGARATVTNSLLRDSATHGIVVGADATFDGSDNVYRNNADGEIERR